MKLKKNIKASSLSNAIFVCLIISIFCGVLVLISHYNNLLIKKIELDNDLIKRNQSAFSYFLKKPLGLAKNSIQEIDVFDDGIISQGELKQWGYYHILVCKTFFKKDTITKAALIGKKSLNEKQLALYTTNYDKTLRVSGKITLLGDLEIPNGKIERTIISNQIENEIKLGGSIRKSNDNLPDLMRLDVSEYFLSNTIEVNSIKSKSIYNPFENRTLRLNVSGNNIKELSCKGNIIVTSNRLLVIDESNTFQDIILKAPKVIVKKGFKGNLQIIADTEVIIEENVKLLYPSSIYVENDTDSVSVKLNKNSFLAGGIVVNGSTYTGSLKRKIELEENSKVVGNVYCYGSLSLQGEVIGSVYTDKFHLKTKSSDYENLILNGTINRDSLDANFVELPLFNEADMNYSYQVIKTF